MRRKGNVQGVQIVMLENILLKMLTGMTIITSRFGWWRSLVAHLTGGQGVAGSNPVHPTRKFRASARALARLLFAYNVLVRTIGGK